MHHNLRAAWKVLGPNGRRVSGPRCATTVAIKSIRIRPVPSKVGLKCTPQLRYDKCRASNQTIKTHRVPLSPGAIKIRERDTVTAEDTGGGDIVVNQSKKDNGGPEWNKERRNVDETCGVIK